jgi:predicted short-subunit dehydrogenase-like oxidoreductase (DUF2520 family)
MEDNIAIVGRGRIGSALGLAWAAAGADVTLLARGAGAGVELPLAIGRDAWLGAIRRAGVVVLATPDAAITEAAASVAELNVLTPAHVVLHCSGLLDRTALEPAQPSGAALGSVHPLMAVTSSAAVAMERLRGAFAGIEGDARAEEAAERLARMAGMFPVRISATAKPAYHAAAAMTSNFTVAVYDAARRVAVHGGVPESLARQIYLPLLRGTVENLETEAPSVALTGAIRRGDAATVAAHLAAVGSGDLRRLYLELGWATLALARQGGLEPALADRIGKVLRGD